jgi:hypothetical protein
MKTKVNFKKVLSVSLIVVIALGVAVGAWFALRYFISRAAEPEKNAILMVTPATGSYKNDESFSLNVKVDTKNQEIGSIRALVKYDPKVLIAEEATKGTDCVLNTFMADIDQEKGEVSLLGSTNKTTPGGEEKIVYKTTDPNNPGQVMRIDFKVNTKESLDTKVDFIAGKNGVYLAEEINQKVYNILGETRGGTYKINGGSGEEPLDPPVLKKADAGDKKVDLGWTKVERASAYTVFYGTTSKKYTESKEIGNLTTYSVTGLTNGTPYYFAVKARSDQGDESNYSNELSATPKGGGEEPEEIPAPFGLTATAGNKKVNLTWEWEANSATPGSNPTYNLYRTELNVTENGSSIAPSNFTKIKSGLTEKDYTDSAVVNGTTYEYYVTAVLSGKESKESNHAIATPNAEGGKLAADIAHNEDGNAVYGRDGRVDAYDFIFLMSVWYWNTEQIKAAGYTDPNVDYAKYQSGSEGNVILGSDGIVSAPEFIWMMMEWGKQVTSTK